MKLLHDLIKTNEDWLMQRILDYAIEHDYAKYTSTLKESWQLSIAGLSGSLLEAISAGRKNLELGPDEDYTKDTIASFGILEAKRHRERGIDIGMFMGLLKYYRRSYKNLIDESILKRLRSCPDLKDKCIIATSAGVYPEDREKCLETGADGFLPKPVRIETLLDLLNSCLDLDWTYAADPESAREDENMPKTSEVSLSACREVIEKKLCILPETLIRELSMAVHRTDPGACEILIHKIREQDESLAASLKQLADDFRFDILQGLLKETTP